MTTKESTKIAAVLMIILLIFIVVSLIQAIFFSVDVNNPVIEDHSDIVQIDRIISN